MSTWREVYRPSGRVRTARLILWFFLTLPLTLLSGYLLCLAFRLGLYIEFIAPIVAALPALLATWITVRQGHCRNRWIGAATGAAVGLVALLSSYQIDLAYETGLAQIYRVERLPEYIQHRLKTDRVEWLQRMPAKVPAEKSNPNARDYILFTADALVLVLLSIWAGWGRARRPFSEKHQSWFHEHLVNIPRSNAYILRDILSEHDPEALARAARKSSVDPVSGWGEMRLYYVPYEPATPVYLTLRVHPGLAPWQIGSRKLAGPVKLTPHEACALAERLRPPGCKAAAVLTVQPVEDQPPLSAAGGTIEEISPGEVAGIRQGRTYALLVAINLLPLVLGLLIVIGLIIALAVYWSALGRPGQLAFAFIIMSVIVGTLAFAVRYADELPIRLQRRWCMAAIRRRAQPLVDPDDPEATYVEFVPRKNWGKIMFNNADDIGFLKVDRHRQMLLFEGDRQRWSIPAASIESCEMEEFCIGQPEPKERNIFALAVVRANVAGQVWEAPLLPARTTGRRPLGKVRRQWCRRLFDTIHHDLLAGIE
ncbi:MAG TPA: hypothetical protein VGZ47_09955 [Gemmataceae bacterium]|jgi:hypothetical protein|nr:hypothetical protein [Gemmataceae bacterium]